MNDHDRIRETRWSIPSLYKLKVTHTKILILFDQVVFEKNCFQHAYNEIQKKYAHFWLVFGSKTAISIFSGTPSKPIAFDFLYFFIDIKVRLRRNKSRGKKDEKVKKAQKKIVYYDTRPES